MKAEDILKEARQEVSVKYGFNNWKELLFNAYNFQGNDGIRSFEFYNEEASLLAMSKAWEKGFHAGTKSKEPIIILKD